MYPRTHARVAALCAAAMALAGREGAAVSTRYAPSGHALHWHADVVDFLVDPAARDAAIPDPEGAMRTAAAQWAAVPGAARLRVATGSAGAVGYLPGQANLHGMTFFRQGFPMQTTALALTLLTTDADSGAILDGDVIVQASRYPFAELRPPGTPGLAGAPFDFQSVMTHELGHVLGLGEDYAHPEATMFPATPPGDLRRRALSPEDLASLRLAYTMEPTTALRAAPGCGARIAPVTLGSRRGGHWIALAGLGLLGAAALRRGRSRAALVAGVVLLAVGAPTPASPGERAATVVRAHATMQGGLIVTSAEVERDGVVREVTALGGQIGNLRQEVLDAPSGTALVPGAGVTLDGERVTAVYAP